MQRPSMMMRSIAPEDPSNFLSISNCGNWISHNREGKGYNEIHYGAVFKQALIKARQTREVGVGWGGGVG